MTLNIPPLPNDTPRRQLPEPTFTITIPAAVVRKMRADITFNGRPCEVHINVGGISYPVTSLSLQNAIYPAAVSHTPQHCGTAVEIVGSLSVCTVCQHVWRES